MSGHSCVRHVAFDGRAGRSRSPFFIVRMCALAIVAVTTTLPACGYSLAGRGSFLPAYIKTIGVPAFANRTPVFNVETQLTEKVRREFIGRGKYTVLPQANDVDATLVGEVSSVQVAPAAFSQNTQLATRYTITMTARIELRDNRTNSVLWENPSLVFRQDYDATSGTTPGDAAAFFGHETNALDRVSTEFARTIVSAILEAF
jgi:outer membrane lipopolysaccharide assembly protein LptE/RlpB